MNRQIILIALAVFTFTFARAQNDTYRLKTLRDDPNAVSDHLIGINGCHAHFSKREHLKAGIGVDVLWPAGNNLQVQASAMFYYLAIRNTDGPDYSFDGGLALTLGQRSRVGECKVILSHVEEVTRTVNTTTKTTTTKYLVSQATYLSKTKLRTGLYMKQAGMDVADENGGRATYFGLGAYGGIEWSKQACLFSEVNEVKGVTSGYSRFYIDGIFLPVSKLEAATADKPGKFGFRVGYEAFFNPNKKKNAEYGKLVHYQMYPSLYWKIEAGIRGHEGWFFQMGLGFLVHRNK